MNLYTRCPVFIVHESIPFVLTVSSILHITLKSGRAYIDFYVGYILIGQFTCTVAHLHIYATEFSITMECLISITRHFCSIGIWSVCNCEIRIKWMRGLEDEFCRPTAVNDELFLRGARESAPYRVSCRAHSTCALLQLSTKG
jgi:hypothetical protein